MRGIKSISLNLPMVAECYTVGQKVNDQTLPRDLQKVTEIKDFSRECENSNEYIYDIFVAGQLYKTIINTPVSITYFLDGEVTE